MSAVAVGRSGPAVRQALAEHGAGGQAEQFEAEFRAELAHAGHDFDLVPVWAVVDRWHAVAVVAANRLSDAEQAQLSRARAGDFTGLRARDEHGTWVTL